MWFFYPFVKQESEIRIYNVNGGWKVQKEILAKNLRWTITDASLSPDQHYLVSLWQWLGNNVHTTLPFSKFTGH